MAHTRTHVSASLEQFKTRAYRLTVIDGPDKGKQIETESRLIRIGTNPECDLELNDSTASRFHARIEVDVWGHRIIDDGSKNGCFVNDIRVSDAYLMSECQIQIGANRIQYDLGNREVEIYLSKTNHFGQLIGSSKAMREIFAVLERVAQSDMTILVEGESGTGKELVADAVHQHSRRAGGPFVVFDCSAVAANLVESELFGHVKGAFTGANANRLGAFQRAHGGTLFLDELGELPYDLQAKLLRVLEQKKVRPVGGDQETSVDVRIVAATNRRLKDEVELGQFRQDLFYRLAVIRIVLPPLRRRVEDIPLLVKHFLRSLADEGEDTMPIGYETILKLQAHRWPGNVRELKNFVERATLLSTGDRLETKHLSPPSFGDTAHGDDTQGNGLMVGGFDENLPFKDAKARLIESFERLYWSRLLEKTNGNVSAAARMAGIHRKSAEYLLKKLDLKWDSLPT